MKIADKDKTTNSEAEKDLTQILLELKDYSVMMIDTTGKILSCNNGSTNIFNYPVAALIGSNISDLDTDKERQNGQPWCNLKIAREKGRHEHESWKIKNGGIPFYAHTTITVLYNENEILKGFSVITRDITLQKTLEEENKTLTTLLEEKVEIRTKELEIVNKELEAFSYSVSHDLRAPLRAISGYSVMLKEDHAEKLDNDANRIIDVIVDNTRMMSQLIDDLLTFSKMARLEVINEGVDMKLIAQKCIDEILHTEKVSASVVIHDMPPCKGDRSMLKQVWFNLLSNAVKYSGKKTNPVIEAGVVDNEISTIYYVKDNGAGFDMKYYDKLFGVFQRLHRADEFDGTGLGLALSKRIISKHGGEIWGEAALNKGATFYFTVSKT